MAREIKEKRAEALAERVFQLEKCREESDAKIAGLEESMFTLMQRVDWISSMCTMKKF